jgi:hypothetical protein
MHDHEAFDKHFAELAKRKELEKKDEFEDGLRNILKNISSKVQVQVPLPKVEFNEPEHYHQHDIDTIKFLQRGFPPEVFMGFAIGHIVKYAQRANYKNGREDYVKMVDYAKRALDWYDKTHS